MNEPLLCSYESGVATLTLNRPDRRNALTVPLLEALVAELGTIGESEAIGAVVLTGAGGGFCAGADLDEFALTPDDPGRARRIDLVTEAIALLRSLPQPSIAAVSGPAFGAGWGLALACDLTHASSRATFCLPEVAKGLRLPDAVASRLTEVVGPARAAQIVFSGARYGSAEGLTSGWVARIPPDVDDATPSALDLAQALATHPPGTIRQVTTALRSSPRGGRTPEQR
jgi:2-(1,2-epoxy-1,2-dihydrophenyl)acetyl-CoA isomerase